MSERKSKVITGIVALTPSVLLCLFFQATIRVWIVALAAPVIVLLAGGLLVRPAMKGGLLTAVQTKSAIGLAVLAIGIGCITSLLLPGYRAHGTFVALFSLAAVAQFASWRLRPDIEPKPTFATEEVCKQWAGILNGISVALVSFAVNVYSAPMAELVFPKPEEDRALAESRLQEMSQAIDQINEKFQLQSTRDAVANLQWLEGITHIAFYPDEGLQKWAQEASQRIQQALSNPDLMETPGIDKAATVLARARVSLMEGDMDGARAAIATPEAELSAEYSNSFAIVRGELALHDGRYEDAEMAFEAAILNGGAAELLLKAATAARSAGDLQGARDYLRRWQAQPLAGRTAIGGIVSDGVEEVVELTVAGNVAVLEAALGEPSDAMRQMTSVIEDSQRLWVDSGSTKFACIASDNLINRGQTRWKLGEQEQSERDHDEACDLMVVARSRMPTADLALSTAKAFSSRGWLYILKEEPRAYDRALRDLRFAQEVLRDYLENGDSALISVYLNARKKEAMVLYAGGIEGGDRIFAELAAHYRELEKLPEQPGARAAREFISLVKTRIATRLTKADWVGVSQDYLMLARAPEWSRLGDNCREQAECFDSAGSAMRVLEDIQRAIEIYREGLVACPLDADLKASLASAIIEEGNLTSDSCQEVSRLIGECLSDLDADAICSARLARGVAAAGLGDRTTTLQELNYCLANGSLDDVSLACIYLEEYLVAWGLHQERQRAYLRWMEMDRDNPAPKNAYAWPFVDPDFPDHSRAMEALPITRQAVELARGANDENLWAYLDTQAWAEFWCGNVATALQLLDEAIEDAPVEEKVWYESSAARIREIINDREQH